jgi:arylsulfatase A-like enzyme
VWERSQTVSRNRILIATAVVLAVAAAGVVVVKSRSGGTPTAASVDASGKPNVLMIMTDDETLESIRILDNVKKNITDQGTTFSHYYVSFPNCCPSRATYLTGEFSHNDNVRDNVPPYGGFHNLNGDETLPVWLQRAGYWTASVGKYLNTWGDDGNISPPKGWNHWYGLIDPTTYHYYDYSVSNDGTKIDFGHAPTDYQTDVLGAEVVKTITARAGTGQPWFLSWTPLAPHAQERETASGENDTGTGSITDTFPTPADKYKGTLADEKAPRTASFNQKDMSKMPEFFQKLKPLDPHTIANVQKEYEAELETLKSVDQWVGTIFDTLSKTGQLDNTDVIFTSDNGFYHGEHRITYLKVYLYEQGVHLPLMIRGPGFAKGATADGIVGNVDLAPTILKMAGATSPLPLDGRDMHNVAANPDKAAGRGMLLENLTARGTAHTEGIHTERWVYLTNEKREEELYDLQHDPDETNNIAAEPAAAAIKDDLSKRLDVLRTCKGSTCEGSDGKGG